MHDPMTLIYGCRFFDLWHVDPESDGSDDSCGWFIRGRHVDQKVLDRIVSRFTFEWTHGCPHGWFDEEGYPNYSSHAIVLGMFRIAANEHFGHWSRRASRFLTRHAFDILCFAENNFDSLHDSIIQHYGPRDGSVRDQAYRMASCAYSWIIRADRPWYRHPRWHVWHWKVNIRATQNLKRWLFSRCCRCGKGFSWGYAPTTGSWNGVGPRWFRGEPGVYHSNCEDPNDSGIAMMESQEKPSLER
jgi:hypothetical protein